MEFPEQILNTLRGTDVILIPIDGDENEAEAFVKDHIEPLLALDMSLAIQKDGTSILFNPSYHDSKALEQAAKEDRLYEFVNGAGNNGVPENPTAAVHVTTRNGKPVRSILVDSLEKAASAAGRNMTVDHNVDVEPITSPHRLIGAKVGGQVKSEAEKISKGGVGDVTAPLPGMDQPTEQISVSPRRLRK